MASPELPTGSHSRSDAVDQARAWLAHHTGQVPDAPQMGHGGPQGRDKLSEAGQLPEAGELRDAHEPPDANEVLAGGGLPDPGELHSAHDLPDDRGPSSGHETSSRRSATRGRGRASRSRPQEPDDPDADPEGVARTIALRKLTAQARTRHELDQALQKKSVPEEVAATVLDRLEEVGLVDDAAFAHGWVESRQQRRHLSRSALRRELRAKGVERSHVDAALAGVDSEAELEAARALVAKKGRATSGLDPLVRDRRLSGALARRGFGPGVIATVLGELRGGASEEDPRA